MPKSDNPTTTTLSSDEFARVMEVVESYLKEHPYINNRILRNLTGIGYDQAISFFNASLKKRQLEKTGKASGTVYTLPNAKD